MNRSSSRVLDVEDLRVQDPGGTTLYEVMVHKVFTYLKYEFGTQLNDTDYQYIAAGAFATAFRAGIDPERQPVAYVKKIAKRDTWEYLKRLKEELPTDLLGVFGDKPSADTDPADSEPEGWRAREDADAWDLFDSALPSITAEKARAVIRHQSLGHDTAEIAAELGISANTVYQHRKRAIDALQVELRQYIRPTDRLPAPTKPGEQ